MGFLTPGFLAGLALVGLPIWLHLLKRHRNVPLPFSSLMFFERRTQSSIKHRRLQYLVLLALRTALIILIALAFAGPYLRTEGGLAVTGGRRLMVLAIDNSFSMRQGDRLARAKAEAARTLASLGAQDRAEVIAFGSRVNVLAQPGDDRNTLRAAIESVGPGDGRSSFAELSRALRSIAQSAGMPIEAHLFSDMQRTSLPPNFADLALPAGTRLVPHAVADRRLGNFAVESVKVPREVYDQRKVRVQATVAGFGTEAAARRVALVLNGRELESQNISIPASGRASVEFLSLEVPHGLNRGEVRLDPQDGFPNDDRIYFSVERSDPRRVLFVHDPQSPRDLLYFRAALESSGQSAFQIDAASPEQAANVAFQKYAFVVLSDVGSVPPSFEQGLRTYVRAGGSLLVALGRDAAMRRSVPVFDEGILETRYFGRDGDRFQTAGWLDPAFPAIKGEGRWDDVKFFQAVRVVPGKARIAARLSDDTPLLLEKPLGEGRVLVFASTFDNIANDFPLHATFVPFVEQTAHYLGKLDDSPADFTVGAYLDLREGREKGVASEVLDPSGKRALSLEEASKARNIELTNAGFYEVRSPGGRHELVAVNADRHESDLDVIPADTLALWQNTAHAGAASGGTAQAEKKNRELWWYVLLAALALALAESLVGNRHLSVDQGEE